MIVASTVSLYCLPLVTVLAPLKLRLPVPEGYQVSRQVPPSYSLTVADATVSVLKTDSRQASDRSGRRKQCILCPYLCYSADITDSW